MSNHLPINDYFISEATRLRLHEWGKERLIGMCKRKDLTGTLMKKECCGYMVDATIVKTFMSKQEQLEYGITDKSPNSIAKCNMCGHEQTLRNYRVGNEDCSYRCNHCKGYGHLFGKKIEGTEWTCLRLATEEDMLLFNKEDRYGVFLWCRCSCGEEQPVSIRDLNKKESTKCKKCSSLQLKHANVNVGEKYNMLTIVELTDRQTNDGHYMIRCECECGNTQYYTTMRELKSGRKSCGCIQYNYDLTDEEREIKRNYSESYNFRYNVKSKANYTCDCCGYIGHKHDGVMKAHHLNGWHWFDKDKRDDISNGVCLCESCHKEFHHINGYGDNTEEQYIQFKQRYLNDEFNNKKGIN